MNATPCSSYYGQQSAIDAAAVPGPDASVCRLRVRPVAAPLGAYGIKGGYSFGPYGGSASARARRSRSSTRTTTRRCSRTPTPTPRVTATRPSGGSSSRTTAFPRTRRPVTIAGGNGWYGEQALDVEAVHGMAPNANVFYYGAASCFDDDLLAAAGAGRQRQRRVDRLQLVGRADVRRHRRRDRTPRSTRTSSPRTSPSSSRAPSRASGSASPPATTETSSQATGIAPSGLAGGGSLGDLGRRDLARRSTARVSARSRPAGEPRSGRSSTAQLGATRSSSSTAPAVAT